MSGVDTGSFRDRDGRVYLAEKRVFRGLSAQALKAWRSVSQQSFYQDLVSSGELVETREIASSEVPLDPSTKNAWAGFLEHRRIPFISYPYEWSFSMLRDAALLQLRITRAAVEHDFTLKDATPYNIQFDDGRPVFIDIASFETLQPGSAWAGYRQFCEMFLFPLLLQAYKGVDFQPFLRSRIDGIGVQQAARMFSLRDRFRKGVLGNVWLQAKLEARYGQSSKDVRKDLKSAGFGKELILANLRKLQRLVTGLQWQDPVSEWGDYESFHNYSEADHQAKAAFVAQCAERVRPDLAWDIGCNTGRFSTVAAATSGRVVACDIDHLAIERLYLDPNRPENVLPLLQNIADPSPDWGWKLGERRSMAQRGQPDLVLCLALVHHVVITANIPMAEFVGWLAELTPNLVFEYVSRKDDKVQTLLRNKDDKYSDYSRESCEAALRQHYCIEDELALRDGMRRIYFCRPGAGA
ncbi:MAG: hypothetical protein R3348_07380 [Xanthomonadales bacterium]|nr:hypothetical protein [Xanthomonadales bacterium]